MLDHNLLWWKLRCG